MENPFETLNNRLERIEYFLSNLHSVETTEEPEADLLNVTQTAELLNLAKATIYNLVSRKEIPVFKKGKRLYFSKAALLDWIKEGKKPTLDEIKEEANEVLSQQKRAGHAKA